MCIFYCFTYASVILDTTAPTVDNVSSSTADGSYKINDNVTITVTLSETVIVDNSSGNPRILLETGTNDRYANYVSGNSTSILSFLYTVQSGDNSIDLDFKASRQNYESQKNYIYVNGDKTIFTYFR